MNPAFARSNTKPETEVIIVGAGIAGLYAAYRLMQANIPFKVLEADDHAGGRIKSRKEKNSHLGLVPMKGPTLSTLPTDWRSN
jgi:monoamine oxidase